MRECLTLGERSFLITAKAAAATGNMSPKVFSSDLGEMARREKVWMRDHCEQVSSQSLSCKDLQTVVEEEKTATKESQLRYLVLS